MMGTQGTPSVRKVSGPAKIGPGRNSAGFTGYLNGGGNVVKTPVSSSRQRRRTSTPRRSRQPSPDVPDSEESAAEDGYGNDVQYQEVFEDIVVPVRTPSPASPVSGTPDPRSRTTSRATSRRRSLSRDPFADPVAHSSAHYTRTYGGGSARRSNLDKTPRRSPKHPDERAVSASASKTRSTFRPANLRSGATRSRNSTVEPDVSTVVAIIGRSRVPARTSLSLADAIAQSLGPNTTADVNSFGANDASNIDSLTQSSTTFRPGPVKSQEALAIPAKRPRGRPRKHSLPLVTPSKRGGLRSTALPDAEPDQAMDDEETTAVEENPELDVPAKNLRLRPRKSAPAELISQPKAIAEPPASIKSVPVSFDGHKKRGRPKGSKNKPKAGTGAGGALAPSAAASVAAAITASTEANKKSLPGSVSASSVTVPKPRPLANSALTPSSSSIFAPTVSEHRICSNDGCNQTLPPVKQYVFSKCAACLSQQLGTGSSNDRKREKSAPAVHAAGKTDIKCEAGQVEHQKDNVVIKDGWTSIADYGSDDESMEGETMSSDGFVTRPVSKRASANGDKEDAVEFELLRREEEEEKEEEEDTSVRQLDGPFVTESSVPGKRKATEDPEESPEDGWYIDTVNLQWVRGRPKSKSTTQSSPLVNRVPSPDPSQETAAIMSRSQLETREYQTCTDLYEVLAEHFAAVKSTSPSEVASRATPAVSMTRGDGREAPAVFKGSYSIIRDPQSIVDEIFVRSVAEEMVWGSRIPMRTDRDHTTVILRGRTGTVEMPCDCAADENAVGAACVGRMSVTATETEPPAGLGMMKGLSVAVELKHF